MSNHETESENHSTVGNDNISVNITKKPHCLVKLEITISPKGTEAAYQKALKTINKEVVIPGFRKGRAPDRIILEKYHDVIEKEFVDIVIQTGFNEAIHLGHLHPLKEGKINRPVVNECSREKGAHFIIEFETHPISPKINLEELKITKAPLHPITDLERQNALQNLLYQFATYEPIEDRPVERDDFVNVSVTLLGEHPRKVINDQRSQANETGFPSWLLEKVIGLRAGESAQGTTEKNSQHNFEQDSNATENDSNFEPHPFEITVHSIWKGNLPSVDDELAKQVGLKTVEELYTKIDERLAQEVKEEAFEKDIKAIEHLLLQHFPIDLPRTYIDSTKDSRFNDYIEKLEKEGIDYTQEDYQKIEQSIEKAVISELQLYFLSHKIATDYAIEVTQEEITQELTHQIALMGSGRSNFDFNDREKIKERLQMAALDRKIKRFLIDALT